MDVPLSPSPPSDQLRAVVAPIIVDIPLQTNDLFDVAVEIWRLEQKMRKVLPTLPENQRLSLENSIQKLKRYLEKNEVVCVDYLNQKYNDGLNVELLSVEKDPTITEARIKETIEPTVLYRGQVVRRGKIILIDKA